MSDALAYGVIRKALTDGSFVERLKSDLENTLKAEGIIDPTQAAELAMALNLMSAGYTQQNETMKLFANQLVETLSVASDMKTGLRRTVEQIDKAFRSTMLMYKVSFYMGAALIVVAVGFALITRDSFLPLVFGGLGIADFIAFFVTKPPQDLQNSRASLAQLQAAFFNWFTDAFNQNTYMSLLQQRNQLDFPTMQKMSETLLDHTDKTMEMLQKYCKLT